MTYDDDPHNDGGTPQREEKPWPVPPYWIRMTIFVIVIALGVVFVLKAVQGL